MSAADGSKPAQEWRVERDWLTRAGFRAVVIMGTMGSRCGYVGVPSGHELHGVDYGKPSKSLPSAESEEIGKRSIIAALAAGLINDFSSPDMVFNVHGGLTFSGGGESYPVPSDGVWWFGFDCAHYGDGKCPEYLAAQRERYPDSPFMWRNDPASVFRSLEYVEAECESLAQQIVEKTITAEELARADRLIAESGAVHHETGKTPRQLADEVERLRACLAQANAGHEEFERRYYLESDKVERMARDRAAMVSALRDLDEAYCGVHPDMTREARQFGRKSLIAAREAIALAEQQQTAGERA